MQLEVTAFDAIKGQTPSAVAFAERDVINFGVGNVIVAVVKGKCILAKCFKTVTAKRNCLNLCVNAKPNANAVTLCNRYGFLLEDLRHRR